MPKLKTRKGVKKRFRITATGKILRGSAAKGHLRRKKTRKRKRSLRHRRLLKRSDEQRVRVDMPYG